MYQLEEAVNVLEKYTIKKNKFIEVPLLKADGHVLAADLYAPISVPSFPRSAMDGYALCYEDIKGASEDNPVCLKVLGELCAGEYRNFEIVKGSAVRVMTGAPVPEPYDAVIRQEDTDYGENYVRIYAQAQRFQNYIHIGEDIKKDELILSANTMLKSLHIGLIASLGYSKVTVIEPLKVALISTGTELTEPGIPLKKAQIYNSIVYMLAAKIQENNFEVVSMQNCPDDLSALNKCIKEVDTADIIITTGGASVGKKDIIPEFIRQEKVTCLFQGIMIQPGYPTCASLYNGTPILHLSGNPYAALTHFEMLFWPVVSKMLGNTFFEQKTEKAVLKDQYKKNKIRRLVRACEYGGEVRIPSVHFSSVISNLVECNCLIDMEAGKLYEPGDCVTIHRIR